MKDTIDVWQARFMKWSMGRRMISQQWTFVYQGSKTTWFMGSHLTPIWYRKLWRPLVSFRIKKEQKKTRERVEGWKRRREPFRNKRTRRKTKWEYRLWFSLGRVGVYLKVEKETLSFSVCLPRWDGKTVRKRSNRKWPWSWHQTMSLYFYLTFFSYWIDSEGKFDFSSRAERRKGEGENTRKEAERLKGREHGGERYQGFWRCTVAEEKHLSDRGGLTSNSNRFRSQTDRTHTRYEVKGEDLGNAHPCSVVRRHLLPDKNQNKITTSLVPLRFQPGSEIKWRKN